MHPVLSGFYFQAIFREEYLLFGLNSHIKKAEPGRLRLFIWLYWDKSMLEGALAGKQHGDLGLGLIAGLDGLVVVHGTAGLQDG